LVWVQALGGDCVSAPIVLYQDLLGNFKKLQGFVYISLGSASATHSAKRTHNHQTLPEARPCIHAHERLFAKEEEAICIPCKHMGFAQVSNSGLLFAQAVY
jgi:hypothetical protein